MTILAAKTMRRAACDCTGCRMAKGRASLAELASEDQKIELAMTVQVLKGELALTVRGGLAVAALGKREGLDVAAQGRRGRRANAPQV